MNQKQKLFSDFFKIMIRMRKSLDKVFFSDNGKVSTSLQVQALEVINDHSKITAGELSFCLEISSSSLSQLTDRMIDAKLIYKVHSEVDRRSVFLALTDTGKKHLSEATRLIKGQVSEILAPMSENDLKEVIRIFNNVLEQQGKNGKN